MKPLCSLGYRLAFSKDYNNYYFKGYNVDALIERAEELLHEKMPHIVWLPYTSEVCVEHTSILEARAENPIEEVEACIIECWKQAEKEQEEAMSEEELAHIKALKENQPDFNELFRYLKEYDNVSFE